MLNRVKGIIAGINKDGYRYVFSCDQGREELFWI